MPRRLCQLAPSAPIDPPAGYPKFLLSNKTVEPALALPGGATLVYRIEIVNTGAYTGYNVSLTDPIPANTTYQNDATASAPPTTPAFQNGVLTWNGTVGFDSTVVITFSVNVTSSYSGVISNTAVISHASLSESLSISANAMITDDPLFEIEKTSHPDIPGPNKPIIYTIKVTNVGQEAIDFPVTVTDDLPLSTTFLSADGGVHHPDGNLVTWDRPVDLDTGDSEYFFYTVQVGDVPSGTVISNDNYRVYNPEVGLAVGKVYTTTVLDPNLFLYKETDPYPPGSNREMTYTLVVLNKGSSSHRPGDQRHDSIDRDIHGQQWQV